MPKKIEAEQEKVVAVEKEVVASTTPDFALQVAELTAKLAKSDKDGLALAEENEKLEAKLKEAALSELSVLGQLQSANEAAKLPKKSKSHCEDSKGNKQSVIEVMHASELSEKVKYGVIAQDALVGLLKPESK